MSFQKSLMVHFDDCDPAGIVFFGNYFKLAHRAIEEFLIDLGFGWQEWFQAKDFGVPLIHAEADYKQPMLQGNTYNVRVEIASLGETSVSIDTFFETLNGDACSKVRTVHVFVSTVSRKKIAIPEGIRKKLEMSSK